MELDFVAVVDIPFELARGCPSTACNVDNLASHHWLLGYYTPETQHEVWDANPDALIASSVALAAGRGRKAEGGFIVNGRWPFSSGVDNSDWKMLAVTVYAEDDETPIDWRLCLVPKSEYAIIDTWYAMGAGRQPEARILPSANCSFLSDGRFRSCSRAGDLGVRGRAQLWPTVSHTSSGCLEPSN